MPRLIVEHTSIQHYRRPIGLGWQHIMLRPRDSHDLRMIESRLIISPTAVVNWRHDVFGNSVAQLYFKDPARELKIVSLLKLDHFGLDSPYFLVSDEGRVHPVVYSADEMIDLAGYLEPHYPDAKGVVAGWARRFLTGPSGTPTQEVLVSMVQAIPNGFSYGQRIAHGVQTPIETLTMRTGTCRDFAMLMIDGLRSLGYAARFVSGYLYDPDEDMPASAKVNLDGTRRFQGAGATHAWVQAYLPGAGWVELDPTNGIYGGANLIRVGVARHAGQAMPFRGVYYGAPDDLVRQTVRVRVRRVADDDNTTLTVTGDGDEVAV
jgi:transglutaminase-like putative cysteine protease